MNGGGIPPRVGIVLKHAVLLIRAELRARVFFCLLYVYTIHQEYPTRVLLRSQILSIVCGSEYPVIVYNEMQCEEDRILREILHCFVYSFLGSIKATERRKRFGSRAELWISLVQQCGKDLVQRYMRFYRRNLNDSSKWFLQRRFLRKNIHLSSNPTQPNNHTHSENPKHQYTY